MLESPILFLIFNRPNHTKQVFDTIRKVKPKKLFIAADGPRANNMDDMVKCNESRAILKKIDWECEVYTLFRTTNLGCGRAVSEAISWFFTHVDEGIILEDDCLPVNSFFYYCQELLERFRFNNRIMIISGTNPVSSNIQTNESYIFTPAAGIWGWASWKRAWDNYNFNIPEWNNNSIRNQIIAYLSNTVESQHLISGFDSIIRGELDTWDYQWAFTRILNDGLGVVPKNNLISNIGFGEDSTHTKDSKNTNSSRNSRELEFPLVHPSVILNNNKYQVEINTLLDEKKYSGLFFLLFERYFSVLFYYLKNIKNLWEKKS